MSDRHRGMLAAVILVTACGGAAGTPAMEPPAAPRPLAVVRVADVPASGSVETRDVVVTDQTTARIMRVPPGGTIAEHHHPHFEEVLFVHAGRVSLALDDAERSLAAGDAVFIPAGTVIRGRNHGGDEAILIVSWSRVSDGPLTMPGRGH